jgi:tRNA threonylcarbamoyladenosine biosynthesis protein TsaE
MTTPSPYLHHQCQTEEGCLKFAAALAHAVQNGAVIFLSGPLGAGKTTFARGFLHALGYQKKVKSPTYTLVEPYEVAGKKIFHFDLYRLQQATELLHIGLTDYLQPDAICLIEWPEKGAPYLPLADLICVISVSGPSRAFDLKAQSDKGEQMIKCLAKTMSKNK